MLGTAAWLKPSVSLYLLIGKMHEARLELTEAIDAYLECREKLANTIPAAEMAPLYDALVTDLFKCGRVQETLRYGGEAVSRGAVGPGMLKYYTFALNNPDQVHDRDLVVGGWTAPYYANSRLDLPL